MMRPARLLLLVGAIGVAGACSADAAADVATSSKTEDSSVVISLNVDAVVCEDPDGACVDGDEKTLVGIPEADVRITANGEELWSGTTSDAGRVDAEFSPDDMYLGAAQEWHVTATSPILERDVTGRTHAPDNGGTLSMSVAFPGQDDLVPHG